MHKLSSLMRKGFKGILTAALIGSAMSMTAFADTPSTSLKAGTYDIDAELSCFVNAMGGVDFTKDTGVLKDATVTVDEAGDAKLTLELGMGTPFNIYNVPCTPWISGDYAPGYYLDGEVQMLGESDYAKTAYTNHKSNGDTVETTYMTSLTFPVDVETSEYTMWMYIDSNVMGCQMCDGSGSGASNTPGVSTKHTAKVTLDWASVDTGTDNGGSENDGAGDVTEIEGTVYSADMKLSCYVDAMGGVEFSDGYGLLQGNKIVKDEEDNYIVTLKFGTTSGLTVYTVDCTAFIGKDSVPGYYDADGKVQNAKYTVSSKTVYSGSKEKDVNYVDSMTFPIEKNVSEYDLYLYLDSNVMGKQLGEADSTHVATLTIDWSTLKEGSSESSVSKKNMSATVEYVVENCYEVEIPTTISVDSKTKEGKYVVNADAIPEGGYIIVTADSEGVLKDEYNHTVAFTNTLSQPEDSENEGTKLMEEGDTLNGLIKITGKASSNGTYRGTLNFTINCY